MKKINFSKENLRTFIKNNLIVILGTLILAIGTEMFLLPSNLNTGGVSGIAICFKFLGSNLSSELIISICCYALFFLGFIFLGWNFSAQTLCSTITYPICLFFINWLLKKVPFLSIQNSVTLENQVGLQILLASLFGGVLVGVGCGVTFLGGGSTGGVDIITFIICKYFRKIKSSVSIFAVDALIVVAGFFCNSNHDLALCLEGVLSAFIAAIVVDKIFIGSTQSFVANIVTNKKDELNRRIIEELDRTTTIFEVVGGYSGENKKMLMVSFNIKQYAELRRIVSSTDRKAFMTISRAHEVSGEGFKPWF